MSYINTCLFVIDIFYIGRTRVLGNGIYYLEPQQNHPLRRHNSMCNSVPLPYLNEDGGRTVTQLLLWCFYVKICLLSMNETKNPLHLDCGRSIPATHGGWYDSIFGGASSGVILTQFRRRYRSTTSRCIGFLWSPIHNTCLTQPYVLDTYKKYAILDWFLLFQAYQMDILSDIVVVSINKHAHPFIGHSQVISMLAAHARD